MIKSLYHLTACNNVSSILMFGLIPNFKKGLTVWEDDQRVRNFVWLTDNPCYILETQAGIDWEYSVLRINCDGLIVKPYSVRLRTDLEIVPHEFQYDGVIDPNRIGIYNK
jgi:hypothetical protein